MSLATLALALIVALVIVAVLAYGERKEMRRVRAERARNRAQNGEGPPPLLGVVHPEKDEGQGPDGA